eukprot:TRINITY_DN30821_c0_g1_i1.p2 TRINITY_DN30821_c0_g1~~TRINITY_DN30821_c0_g1_i1.p2  ORF type:complete len:246 (+),score=58.84 TRINITY_DN30821_c0_g1_i1:102-839(+)
MLDGPQAEEDLRLENERLRDEIKRMQELRDSEEALRALQRDVDAQRELRLGSGSMEDTVAYQQLHEAIAHSRASCEGYHRALSATDARFQGLLSMYNTDVLPKLAGRESSKSPKRPGPAAPAAAPAHLVKAAAPPRTSLELKGKGNGIAALPKTRAKRRTVSPQGYGGVRPQASSNGSGSHQIRTPDERRRDPSRTPQGTGGNRRSASRSPPYGTFGTNTSFGSAPGGRRVGASPGLTKRHGPKP